MILMGAVGTIGGFGPWLRNLLANVAVFVTIILMAFLAHFFFWGFSNFAGLGIPPLQDIMAEIPWMNPYGINVNAGGNADIHLPGYGGDPNFLGALVAFGILFLIPHAGNMIRSLISGQPFNYGTAIGEAFGPARTAGLAALQYRASIAEERNIAVAKQAGLPQAPPIWWVNVLRRMGAVR